jgi:hypothetical protein
MFLSSHFSESLQIIQDKTAFISLWDDWPQYWSWIFKQARTCASELAKAWPFPEAKACDTAVASADAPVQFNNLKFTAINLPILKFTSINLPKQGMPSPVL